MITPGFIAPDAPANPTTAGKQEVAIAPISNWASGAIGNVLVFPTTLDEARVKKAFARAASFWPSVVGRYVTASLPGPEFAVSRTSDVDAGASTELSTWCLTSDSLSSSPSQTRTFRSRRRPRAVTRRSTTPMSSRIPSSPTCRRSARTLRNPTRTLPSLLCA